MGPAAPAWAVEVLPKGTQLPPGKGHRFRVFPLGARRDGSHRSLPTRSRLDREDMF